MSGLQISASNPKLHAFATVEKPGTPLILGGVSDWAKLRESETADIVLIPCGDHGATVQETKHVTTDGALHAKRVTTKCR